MVISNITIGSFPQTRLRRLRHVGWLRDLVEEHALLPQDLILPVFVQEGKNTSSPVASMPGVSRLSIDLVVEKAKKAKALGIAAIALFPVVSADKKSENAKEAFNSDNLVCRCVKAIKDALPEMGVICDVALDPYTSHGQDGLLKDGVIVNDQTVDVLCKQSLTLAKSGCDIVAPSDMMDGRVKAIREVLDSKSFYDVSILSYAAKYASGFYGPFRDAIGSAANLGKADKKTYQMNPANSDEALREVALDITEGADMVMVKPAMPYLDVIRRVGEQFTIPVLAYQVSGEYAMMKAAASNGWLEEKTVILESLLACKRAGASAILSYAAIEAVQWLEA